MIRLGTYISKDAYHKLKELSELFGSQTNALEKAITLLHEITKYSIKVEAIINREKLIAEFDNVLIARRNFLHLLRGEFEELIEENYVSAIVRGFLKDDPKNIDNLEEIVMGLRKIYVDANRWFTNIDLKKDTEFKDLIFFHDMNIEFSEFASHYFSIFFERIGWQIVSSEKLPKMFILKIKPEKLRT